MFYIFLGSIPLPINQLLAYMIGPKSLSTEAIKPPTVFAGTKRGLVIQNGTAGISRKYCRK